MTAPDDPMISIPWDQLKAIFDMVGGQSAAARILGRPLISVQYWVREGRIRSSALAQIQALAATGQARPKHLPWPRSEGDIPIGVDLGANYGRLQEVLSTVKPPRGVARDEYESEVAYRLLCKNLTRSAFDPRKGTMGAYLHTVARSTSANLRQSQRRYEASTEIGFTPRIESLLYG